MLTASRAHLEGLRDVFALHLHALPHQLQAALIVIDLQGEPQPFCEASGGLHTALPTHLHRCRGCYLSLQLDVQLLQLPLVLLLQLLQSHFRLDADGRTGERRSCSRDEDTLVGHVTRRQLQQVM